MKHIAVVSYSLDPADELTQDAIVFRDTLNATGQFDATLIHQWRLNETSGEFITAQDWKRFSGVVLCEFYEFWNLRELIVSGIPIICANVGYADDLGLAEAEQEELDAHEFILTQGHPITQGFLLGAFSIGQPVWSEATRPFIADHLVEVLVTTTDAYPVLLAHKTHKIAYFGWYRMSQAQQGSALFKLLVNAAHWAF